MNVRSFTLCCLFVTFGCKSTQHKSKLRSDEAASQDQAFFDAVGNYIVEYNSGDRIFGPKKLIVTFIKLALSADGTVDVNLGTTNRFDNIKKQFHLGFNTLELEAMGRRRSDLAAMSSRFYADLAPFMDDIVAKYPKAQYLRSQIALNKEGMDVLAKAWTLNGQDTVSTYNAHDVNRILLLKTGGADGQDIILEVSALLPADSTAVAANNAAAKSKQDLLDKLWAQAKTLPPPTPPTDSADPEATVVAAPPIETISYKLSLDYWPDIKQGTFFTATNLKLEYINTARRIYDKASYGLQGFAPAGAAGNEEIPFRRQAGKFANALAAMKQASAGLVGFDGGQDAADLLNSLQKLVDQRVPADALTIGKFAGAMPNTDRPREREDAAGTDEPGVDSPDSSGTDPQKSPTSDPGTKPASVDAKGR